MMSWEMWSLVVGCVATASLGCDEGEQPEATGNSAEAPTAAEEPGPDEEGDGEGAESKTGGQPSGTVDGEPFVTRGVLAQRRGESIEIRLFSRSASCASFDADYESRKGEPIVIINVEWPKAEGDRVAFGASELQERLQFCRGRESGRTRCEPRDQNQGSLTVAKASPEGGTLSLDLTSSDGSLSGPLEFTLCPR